MGRPTFHHFTFAQPQCLNSPRPGSSRATPTSSRSSRVMSLTKPRPTRWCPYPPAHYSPKSRRRPRLRDTYTSVANGEDSRIELNSDLVYCNHSCDPSLVFDMTNFEVRVSDRRPLVAGDALTFFYPSSEWKMVQPFKCGCNAGAACLGYIAGSSQIPSSVLGRYWLNDHIRALVDRSSNGTGQMAQNMPQPAADGARVEGAKA